MQEERDKARAFWIPFANRPWLVWGWFLLSVAIVAARTRTDLVPAMAAFSTPPSLTIGFIHHWMQIAAGLVLLSLMSVAAMTTGRPFFRWLGAIRNMPYPERSSAILLTGCGILASGVMALALCGLLYRVVVGVLLGGIALASLSRFTRSGRPADLPGDGPDLAWIRAWVVVALAVFVVFSFTPETWIDSMAYHLAAPADFVKRHKWFDESMDTYRYPLIAEGLFSIGFLFGGEASAMLINLGGTFLVLWILWTYTAELGGRTAAWLAVACLLSSNHVGFHIGNTNQGFYSIAFAWLGVRAWVLSTRGSGPGAVLAGMCLGWALCAKYSALAPLAGILAWHVAALVRRKRASRRVLPFMALGGFAASAVFLANGWLFTGNPVYPVLFGGLGWTPENDRIARLTTCPVAELSLVQLANWGKALVAFLTEEQPLLLMTIPLLFSGGVGIGPEKLTAWGGAVVVWLLVLPCLSFMMPVYPLAAMATALALHRALSSSRGRALFAIRAVIAATLALGMVQSIAAVDHARKSFMAGFGLEPRQVYLRRVLTSYREAVETVARIVPSSERLLVIGDIRGYGFSSRALNRDSCDVPVTLEVARASLSPTDVGKGFRQLGVRYVLLNYVGSEYQSGFWMREFHWRPEEINRYWEYWRRHAKLVWTGSVLDGINGGFVMYRLARHPHDAQRIVPFLPGAEGMACRQAGLDEITLMNRQDMLEQFAPGIVYFRMRIAARLANSGRLREALLLIRPCLGTPYPEKAVLYALEGFALMKLGSLQESLKALRRAEALAPEETQFRALREKVESRLRAPQGR